MQMFLIFLEKEVANISRQTGCTYLGLSFFQLLQDVQPVTKEERLIFRKKVAVDNVNELFELKNNKPETTT